jgi:phage baseplate assembly protein gpV
MGGSRWANVGAMKIQSKEVEIWGAEEIATIERERRGWPLCEVRDGESKWSHCANGGGEEQAVRAILVFTSPPTPLMESRSDKRYMIFKEGAWFKVSHATFSLLVSAVLTTSHITPLYAATLYQEAGTASSR